MNVLGHKSTLCLEVKIHTQSIIITASTLIFVIAVEAGNRTRSSSSCNDADDDVNVSNTTETTK